MLKCFAKLEAVYGVPRDRAPELMAAAWMEALGHLTADTLRAAVAHAVRVLKFFPTPAEILAIVESQREHVSRLPSYSADMEPPFEPTPEELARVSAMCAAWRAEFADKTVIADRFEAWEPASQGGASDELKALVAKQRARASEASNVDR